MPMGKMTGIQGVQTCGPTAYFAYLLHHLMSQLLTAESRSSDSSWVLPRSAQKS